MIVYFILIMSCTIKAEEPVIPAIIRNTPDFYGAIGNQVTVSIQLAAALLPQDETTFLDLTISNVKNPKSITRPELENIAAYQTLFQFETGETKTTLNSVTFRYTIRPRQVGEGKIPRLRFAFFNPSAAEGRQLQSTYSEPLPFTVISHRKTLSKQPDQYPERFQQIVRNSAGTDSAWAWLSIIPITGIILLTFSLLLNQKHKKAISKNWSEGAAVAFKKIRGASRSNDPADIIANAVREYVQSRPGSDDNLFQPFFLKCDEIRFSNRLLSDIPLASEAENIIRQSEETT